MLHIRLGEADRERLGCPEWIVFDPASLLLSEAETIDDHGIDWEAIRFGEPVLGPDGKPMLSPTGVPLRRFKPRAQRVWVWIALRRAGVDTDLSGLDFDLDAVEWRSDPAESPGKDNGSGTSEPPTASSSPDSGAGRRRRPATSPTTSSATTAPSPTS